MVLHSRGRSFPMSLRFFSAISLFQSAHRLGTWVSSSIPTCLLQVKSTWSVNPVISTYVTSGAFEIWFLYPLQSPWLTLWCQAGLIIVIHYILAWASRTSRNSSVYKILLRGPSHKLQSISTSLQFSKIFTGSLSLNGLSIKFLFSLSRPSWMASPLICINMLIPQTHYSSTRSSRTSALFIPRTRTSTGKRAFSVAAPRIWNSLPADVRTTTSVSSFRSKLKTHFFKIAFPL